MTPRLHAGTLLARTDGWLSGEQMSQALGITRAAVWKDLAALREDGWPIEASTRLGYRLSAPPEKISALWLNAKLPEDNLFAGKVDVQPVVDSTNTRLKASAAAGAPAGTVLIAEEQTGGRGTYGRSFASPKGEGLYLSAILRPKAPVEELLTLTGWIAVAVREGIAAASGAPTEIKWLNDIWLHGRKLVGILTELSFTGESGEPDYVVAGMGINLTQTEERFREMGLQDIAVSLGGAGYPVNPNALALSILQTLDQMMRDFPRERAQWLERYRAHCLTPGRKVSYEDAGKTKLATALSVDDRFALTIQPEDGSPVRTVYAGTVRML